MRFMNTGVQECIWGCKKYLPNFVAQKHFTASNIGCLQKLGLVGMVGCHYMFLILKYF